MASTLRAARCLRLAPSSRYFSTSRVSRIEQLPNVGSPVTQKKPVGAFRGGIVGFLAGFSLAASFAAYHLLDEYNQASAALQASVDELKLSTEKITAHISRIEAVEKDLKALQSSTSSKDDLVRLRAEVKKIYDGLHVEFLDLRTHVWGIQKDVHSLSKKDASEVRI
ncbi:hypothetical protein FB45DRAFT_896852 [Roridomyces roridus]|uniref:IncA domain-containing protein n=1 Tax=Roridomyces roridus TaxID=1738132 RepID=A0AAD7CAU1_9AGAR|nr:hypothetical protein FB45DRAFT_896852 [Roridomyces roridus]